MGIPTGRPMGRPMGLPMGRPMERAMGRPMGIFRWDVSWFPSYSSDLQGDTRESSPRIRIVLHFEALEKGVRNNVQMCVWIAQAWSDCMYTLKYVKKVSQKRREL